jgi:hypothetical protein
MLDHRNRISTKSKEKPVASRVYLIRHHKTQAVKKKKKSRGLLVEGNKRASHWEIIIFVICDACQLVANTVEILS